MLIRDNIPLLVVESLYSTFTVENMYQFEKQLSSLHLENHHIREKIRQQLQVLRDSGFIQFVKPGVYKINDM